MNRGDYLIIRTQLICFAPGFLLAMFTGNLVYFLLAVWCLICSYLGSSCYNSWLELSEDQR